MRSRLHAELSLFPKSMESSCLNFDSPSIPDVDRNSTLGYLSPMAFEKNALATTQGSSHNPSAAGYAGRGQN
jgi:hypothetical protein